MALNLNTKSGKIIFSAALLGTAAAVAGLGTFGGFTSTTSASTAVDTGTTVIGLDAGNAVGGLSVPAAGLLPGDRAERLVNLSNLGSSDLGAISLTAAGSVSNDIINGNANGLKLTVESCSEAWVSNGANGFNGPAAAGNRWCCRCQILGLRSPCLPHSNVPVVHRISKAWGPVLHVQTPTLAFFW